MPRPSSRLYNSLCSLIMQVNSGTGFMARGGHLGGPLPTARAFSHRASAAHLQQAETQPGGPTQVGNNNGASNHTWTPRRREPRIYHEAQVPQVTQGPIPTTVRPSASPGLQPAREPPAPAAQQLYEAQQLRPSSPLPALEMRPRRRQRPSASAPASTPTLQTTHSYNTQLHTLQQPTQQQQQPAATVPAAEDVRSVIAEPVAVPPPPIPRRRSKHKRTSPASTTQLAASSALPLSPAPAASHTAPAQVSDSTFKPATSSPSRQEHVPPPRDAHVTPVLEHNTPALTDGDVLQTLDHTVAAAQEVQPYAYSSANDVLVHEEGQAASQVQAGAQPGAALVHEEAQAASQVQAGAQPGAALVHDTDGLGAAADEFQEAGQVADDTQSVQVAEDKARIQDVYCVLTGQQAEKYLSLQPRQLDPEVYGPNPCDTTRYVACDTEVAYIDVKTQSPVGHGVVNCVSMYCGPDVDLRKLEDPHIMQQLRQAVEAAGAAAQAGAPLPAQPVPHLLQPDVSPALPPQSRVWVDVWDEVDLQPRTSEEESEGCSIPEPVWEHSKVKLKDDRPIISALKTVLEDPHIHKVWHNYGFDRHVLANMGIECAGFAGDTMHMARLHDASRSGKKTYSLESLTHDNDIMRELLPGRNSKDKAKAINTSQIVQAKTSMKQLFGVSTIRKDGTLGKVVKLPPIHELHDKSGPHRDKWIHYSALDAQATWQLREALFLHLSKYQRRWVMDEYLKQQAIKYGRWREAAPRPADAPAPGPVPAPIPVTTSGPTTRRRGGGKSSKKTREIAPAAGPQELGPTMWDLYNTIWRPFGELLTSMERRGMAVNREHLRRAEVEAEAAVKRARKRFLDWVASVDSDAQDWGLMNPSSGAQIRQLLYPDHPGEISKPRKSDGETAAAATSKASSGPSPEQPGCRKFKVPNPDYPEKKGEKKWKDITLWGVYGRGVPGRLEPEGTTATGAATVSMRVLKVLSGKLGKARDALAKLLEEERAAGLLAASNPAVDPAVRSVLPDHLDEVLHELMAHDDDDSAEEAGDELEAEGPLNPASTGARTGTALKKATVQLEAVQQQQREEEYRALEKEAKEKGYGKMYAAMGGGKRGLEACAALEALCEASAIEKLLSAFIKPLQGDNISTTLLKGGQPVHRIHCSLNINTETGRLSARRPNLQNQPALEKDLYKVRQAFTAEAGKVLIVADYGQLELRLLAHMADCKSMLEAFVLGGDFHSRTAYGMYPEIRRDVDVLKECYIEYDQDSDRSKPLVKDKYASERRKAKILNFSIAYGKTAHGLAKDFGTSLEEAHDTVNMWYSDRHEVRAWQEHTKQRAREMSAHGQTPSVYTLLGRTRPLPDLMSNDWSRKGHAERAAINTPIQGAAADVASSAMIAIEQCPRLKALGFQLLMQVHDEVILEGPEAHAQEAQQLVRQHMANPWATILNPPATSSTTSTPHAREWPASDMPLRVELATDGGIEKTWYDAK